MNMLKSLAMALCLLVAVWVTGQAQPTSTNYYVQIKATGGTETLDSVYIGLNPAATNNVDGLLTFTGGAGDTLREREWPPFPPAGQFDFRCVQHYPYDTLGGTGTVVNIHRVVRETQTDSYKLSLMLKTDGTDFTVMWPAGLASVGGGYWHLKSDGITTTFADVDMTTQTSYTFPASGVVGDQNFFYIVSGDAKAFRTGNADSIALAVDMKGKWGKYEKYKANASVATFNFPTDPVLDTPYVNGLHVEFSQTIDQTSLSVTHLAGAGVPDAKFMKWDFPLEVLHHDSVNTVSIFAHGNKGKALTVKKYWWKKDGGTTPYPTKKNVYKNLPTPVSAQLLYPVPNWNNIGTELYASSAFGANGIVIGDATKLNYITHPKWQDVTKTLNKKGLLQNAGPIDCMSLLKGKPWKKPVKSAPPDKAPGPNAMFSQIIALKINIAMSQYGKVAGGTGLALLQYNGSVALLKDLTVQQIADMADKYISCVNPDTNVTGANYMTALTEINNAFNGAFRLAGATVYDNFVNWASGTATVLAPVKPLAEVTTLYRPTLATDQPALIGRPMQQIVEPEKYSLSQNYPNPFNPTTTIEFNLKENALVTLKIYNILGQEVATLVNHEQMESGNQAVDFDATRLASGVYYYRLVVNDGQFQQVKKMMLIK